MMEITHKRKFLPVGHGAFFIERLYVDGHKVLTAVYDCGDSDNGELVDKFALQEFITEDGSKEQIDLLFISHFDEDHINGLKYIQPYLTIQTRVFLPFYYANLQSIYDRKKRSGIPYVISILNQVHITPTLIQYSNDKGQVSEIDFDDFNPDYKGGYINSGQILVKRYQGKPIWKFVPFNLFNEQQLYNDFVKKVQESLHWHISKLQDASGWSDDDIKDLRKIYQSYGKLTINDNSLIVLSDSFDDVGYHYSYGVKQKHIHKIVDFPKKHWYCCRWRPSCLYTGDTVLKRGVRSSKYSDRYEKFLKELRLHTNQISLMQIPHHGSSNNINMQTMCDCLSLQMFCNFSTKDMSHQSFMLNTDIFETLWKNVIKVTEQDNTVFEQETIIYN